MSNKQVGLGRRSSRKKNPKCQKNYGKGDSVGYAANVALDDFYTRASHFNTRATHKQRVKTFVKYCKRQKMRDVRNIDKPFVLLFGAYVAYSRPRLPLIPDEACHPFHAKAATDSTATLPPRQVA